MNTTIWRVTVYEKEGGIKDKPHVIYAGYNRADAYLAYYKSQGEDFHSKLCGTSRSTKIKHKIILEEDHERR